MSEIPPSSHLSRRERQVVEVLARLGRASAREVRAEIPQAPTDSAVRSILRILVAKGFVRKEADAGRDLFFPAAPVKAAKRGLLRNLVRNFFAGDPTAAACALLSEPEMRLSAEEAEKLMKLIREARRR